MNLNRREILSLLSSLACLPVVGCKPSTRGNGKRKHNPNIIRVPNCVTSLGGYCPYPRQPSMDLPVNLRQRNWVRGSGSCVHASTVSLLRWQGKPDLAEWWRQQFGGGEYAENLHRKMDAAGLKYAYTLKGDVGFLEWCCRTRRGALVNDVSGHVRNIVGLDLAGPGANAFIMDNNQPGVIRPFEREAWIRQWQGVSGWATTLVYDPTPPTPHA